MGGLIYLGCRKGLISDLWLGGATLFFDLAGTLVPLDGRLSTEDKKILIRVGSQAHRVILITGQCADDLQVVQLLRFFSKYNAIDFVAYTTRGGMRLVKQGSGLKVDQDYLAKTHLDEELVRRIYILVEATIRAHRLTPLIPVSLVDQTAIRINLAPKARMSFVNLMRQRLKEFNSIPLQAVIEGRTSIFIMRQDIGKRMAVAFECSRLTREGFTGSIAYFGNEFYPNGNDYEVLEIKGLHFFILGNYSRIPPGVTRRSLGQGPQDLYQALENSLENL